MGGGAGDWDARTYDRVANPHEEWAARLLALLPLRGDETVLDAGCGSGRVTRLLLERLPRGRVIGVDASPAMLAVAREQLAPFGGRVEFIEADLTAVSLPEQVDAVFSNATFHWVKDHDALFTNLARLLRPDGTLAAQCGGAGNIAATRALVDRVLAAPPFAAYRATMRDPWNFAGAEETAERLRAAGFEVLRTWLEPSPERSGDRAAFATFLRTVILRPYLDVLPETLRPALVEAVVAQDERDGAARTVDYVRLNMHARRRTPTGG